MSPHRLAPLLGIAGALLLTATTACSGGDDPSTPTSLPSTTEPGSAGDPAGTGSDTGPAAGTADDASALDDDLASAMWLVDDVGFETNDFWRGADADGSLRNWQLLPGSPLVAVADNADGHVAFVSGDLVDFRPVHRGCCGFTYADRHGDRVVIVAASQDGSAAFASPDAGASWTTHDIVLPGGSDDNPFVPTGIAVTPQGYLATGEPALGGLQPATVWRSDDLDTWTPIALPGLDPALPSGSSVDLMRGGTGEFWIVATMTLDNGIVSTVTPFRATDGSAPIEALASFTGPSGKVAPVGERLVLWPFGAGAAADDSDGFQPWILVDHDGWARAPVDEAQWGDHGVDVYATRTDPVSGRVVAAIERRLESFICPGAGVCELTETALVTSDDGLAWRDVEPGEWVGPDAFAADTIVPSLAPIGDGGWLVWRPTAGSDEIVLHRWTGPATLTTSDPLVIYRDGPIAVGESVRVQFGYPTWICNADIYLEGTNWVFDPVLPQDPPDDWPVTFPTEAVIDGPNVYYDGTIERVAEDRAVFSMRGVDDTFVATPGGPC